MNEPTKSTRKAWDVYCAVSASVAPALSKHARGLSDAEYVDVLRWIEKDLSVRREHLEERVKKGEAP